MGRSQKATSKPEKPPPPRPRARTKEEAREDRERRSAAIWALRREGKSYREIARELKVSPRDVAEAIFSDPEEGKLYRAESVEARSSLWRKHETDSISQAMRIQEAGIAALFEKIEKEEDKAARAELLLQFGARWAAVCRQSAADSARAVKSLDDGAIEIGPGGGNAEDLVFRRESLIGRAVKLGVKGIEALPAEYQVEALRRLQKQEAEAAGAGSGPGGTL